MHVPNRLIVAACSLLILNCAASRFSLADDSSKSGSAPKPATAANASAPPELTERERWLLDRVEKLEQRVAELEGKHLPVAAPLAAEASASAPGETALAVPLTVSPASNTQPANQQAPGSPKAEPFAFADFTWLNGNARTKEPAFDTKFFTPEIRVDADYIYDFHHPKDDTIGGSSEVFRANEVHLTQLGVGGDFHFENVRARLMTQFGLYSQTTPRNDASPSRGQWNLDNAYRYISEAYGGYHFNALHGVNVDAGIFMSYVGLFSYYNFDNWAYQPSYVSSNTPWFFNGVRVQVFPTEKFKIEGWLINGWQSYGRFNNRPGTGMQFLWRPNGWLSVLGNQYILGADTLNNPGRIRYHTDDSIQIKYYDNKEKFFDKAAFSLTGDMGCEHGGGVSCAGNSPKGPKQSFLGYMLYNRVWFDNDRYALTLGGGKINNPGRYLVLIPPVNGATAASGTPYFTANPGDPYKAWDASATFDWMPSQYITFRWEFNHRAANVPYFSGSGGVTPPGGNNGAPGSLVCLQGFVTCDGSRSNTWFPDLRKIENRLNLAILVKF
ncbi:MAG: outer membrane beta-barrel protein [Acidobacteria bacterium]|nr:outer membrane beta-barrel protein [Acidobacteriota bacterium]MBS1865862.1 outer membrane beta-barrel protein [Acidobacteriota bacterium]